MTTSLPVVLFFTGTDTDVGKTYCAAKAAEYIRHCGLKVGVYKPVASGCDEVSGKLNATDAQQLWEAAGCPETIEDVCPQKFRAGLAPTSAAALENKQVDSVMLRSAATVWETNGSDVLIVEGAGGLFSPLADDLLNFELIKQFKDARVVLVASNRLGVIHQVLSSCRAAALHEIDIAAVILSSVTSETDDSCNTNRSQIRNSLLRMEQDVPVIEEVGFCATAEAFGFIRDLVTAD